MLNATIHIEHKGLYVFVLFASMILTILALGPGIFSAVDPVASIHSIQHQIFNMVCHQDPLRSFSVNGGYMAVCSRCIGIYAGFTIIWLGMPWIARMFKLENVPFLQLFIGAIMLNLVDVFGNLIQFWTNTDGSRFIFGIIFGVSTALLLINEFFKQKMIED